jgi:hypothetical protein
MRQWVRYPNGFEELFENGKPVRLPVTDKRRETELTIRRWSK